MLEPASGDSVAVKTETWISHGDTYEKSDGLSNGGFDLLNTTYALRGVLESTDGNVSVTSWATGRAVVTDVHFGKERCSVRRMVRFYAYPIRLVLVAQARKTGENVTTP